MADWSLLEHDWPSNQYDPYQYPIYNPYYHEKPPPEPMSQCLPPQAQPYVPPSSPTLTLLLSSPQHLSPPATLHYTNNVAVPRGDNPRETRNKAEKQRRDKLNKSIADLAAMVPPVVAASRKIDKTGVLRLTAHYLRAHQYVFGDSIGQSEQELSASSAQALLSLLRGFLITTTYKGIIVVVSQNVHQYLGYTEHELLGQSIFSIIHEDDRQLLKEQLMPKSNLLGPNGELLIPDGPDGKQKVAHALASEKRRFIIRFKKLGQRTEPSKYVTCHIEGTFRKSDRACRGYNRCCQMVRRARARGDNPCSSGNDVVFIGIVRPTTETFISESGLESFCMEYRTRHSIDGEIIQCEQRIALVTGYMTHEVNGINAMNFMHRDDVRWVIIALREMYDQHRLFGESCYRLMTKNGQFIYMRTRGRLDVNQDSRAVTSFVCTNTVVEEQEGKHLIKLMKKKFTLMVNNNDDTPEDEDIKDVNDSKTVPVEDPRLLEKVILHLVTNLPSPQPDDCPRSASPDPGESPSLRLAIIPPKRERIISAIEKIYSVIKSFKKGSYSVKSSEEIVKEVCSNENNAMPPSTDIENILNSTKDPILSPVSSTITSQEFGQSSLDKLLPDSDTFGNFIFQSQTDVANIPDEEPLSETSISSESYPEMTSIAYPNVNQNYNPDEATAQSATKINYHVLIASRLSTNNSNLDNKDIVPQLQPAIGTVGTGLKRPNDSGHLNSMNKKKNTNMILEDKRIDLTTGQDSPALENFFDEAILNTQIESAIISLEQTIDPTFPDLLISNEVQDILSEIEEDPDERVS